MSGAMKSEGRRPFMIWVLGIGFIGIGIMGLWSIASLFLKLNPTISIAIPISPVSSDYICLIAAAMSLCYLAGGILILILTKYASRVLTLGIFLNYLYFLVTVFAFPLLAIFQSFPRGHVDVFSLGFVVVGSLVFLAVARAVVIYVTGLLE